jgi:hypothetical protein
MTGVAANRRVTGPPGERAGRRALPPRDAGGRGTGLLTPVADSAVLDVAHRENDFVDFDRERLIPRMVSTEGRRWPWPTWTATAWTTCSSAAPADSPGT